MKNIKTNFMKNNFIKNRILMLLILCISIISAFSVYGALSDSSVIQISLLNQDPNPARAGDTVTLRFKVENLGGQEVQNLNLQLVEDYPFTVVGGTAIQSVPTISAFQAGNNYATVEYTVKIDKDAVEGQKQLQLKYGTSSNTMATIKFTVSIASNNYAQISYVDQAKLAPGKETPMSFTVTNIGNAPLQNLVFSWNEANGVILPVYSSDTKYVTYLDVGQSVNFSYTVIADVNAKPGLYKLNLNLESQSASGTASTPISTKVGVFVGGETDFDVAFSESSAGQTSLSVSNTGNNPAQSVSVSIPNQPSYRVSGSNSAIIGNLDKGDYTLVSFQIVSSAGSNGTQGGQRRGMNYSNSSQSQFGAGNFDNGLKVQIDYTDTTGARRSVVKNVPIQFRSASGTGTGAGTSSSGFSGRNGAAASSSFIGSTTFWIIIIVVIIGFFVVFGKRIFAAKK